MSIFELAGCHGIFVSFWIGTEWKGRAHIDSDFSLRHFQSGHSGFFYRSSVYSSHDLRSWKTKYKRMLSNT